MKILVLLIALSFGIHAQASEYFMTVKTKTADNLHAGTDNLAIFVELNKNDQLRYQLGNKNKNDFESLNRSPYIINYL